MVKGIQAMQFGFDTFYSLSLTPSHCCNASVMVESVSYSERMFLPFLAQLSE